MSHLRVVDANYQPADSSMRDAIMRTAEAIAARNPRVVMFAAEVPIPGKADQTQVIMLSIPDAHSVRAGLTDQCFDICHPKEEPA